MTGFVVACAVGCLLRYALEVLVSSLIGHDRIWGTLGANVIGCGVVGLVFVGIFGHSSTLVPLCGGLTSFSSAFAGPLQSWHAGHDWQGTLVLVATPILCLAAFVAATLI